MRNRKGYTRTALSWPDGRAHPEALVCDAYPHLAVVNASEQDGWYWVVHVPSGDLAAIVEGQDAALALIAALGPLEGLERDHPSGVVLLAALAVIDEWKESRVPKQRKPPAPLTVQLEPVYNPGVTPSRAVRAADAELASLLGRAMGGEKVDLAEISRIGERAARLAWKELLMAEIKQTLANPDELPQAPYYLVDGTPCTWEGWKEEYKQLVRLGNDLQVVAHQILDLTDMLGEGYENKPSKEWLQQYRMLDVAWLSLIADGWRHWGRAVSHLLASPPVRQRQVEAKLGYVGNRERGWGALGQKTFLRHPEVAEASKARRMVQLVRGQ